MSCPSRSERAAGRRRPIWVWPLWSLLLGCLISAGIAIAGSALLPRTQPLWYLPGQNDPERESAPVGIVWMTPFATRCMMVHSIGEMNLASDSVRSVILAHGREVGSGGPAGAVSPAGAADGVRANLEAVTHLHENSFQACREIARLAFNARSPIGGFADREGLSGAKEDSRTAFDETRALASWWTPSGGTDARQGLFWQVTLDEGSGWPWRCLRWRARFAPLPSATRQVQVEVGGIAITRPESEWASALQVRPQSLRGATILPYTPIVAGLAADTATWGAAVWIAGFSLVKLRRLLRGRGGGRCVHCGHQLGPTPPADCPECGRAFATP